MKLLVEQVVQYHVLMDVKVDALKIVQPDVKEKVIQSLVENADLVVPGNADRHVISLVSMADVHPFVVLNPGLHVHPIAA